MEQGGAVRLYPRGAPDGSTNDSRGRAVAGNDALAGFGFEDLKVLL